MKGLEGIKLPPGWVLAAARQRLNQTNSWEEYYQVLCAWYGIRACHAVKNAKKLPPEADAVYYKSNETVYAAESMNEKVGLHEFFHHLMHVRKIKLIYEVEQVLADQYALHSVTADAVD